MLISGGITIQGGILFSNYENNIPNPYTANYTFLSGVTYQQPGCVQINPNVCLTFEESSRYVVLPS